MNYKIKIFAWCFYLFAIAGAAPTELHIWKSTAGTSLEARATSVEGGVVTLETTAGKVIKLKAEMLVEADRALLNTHFSDKAAVVVPAAAVAPGQVLGPVAAGESHYYYYVPKSLRPGRKAPLLFFTGAGNGDAGRLTKFQEGAEICSWILAISVECKNGLPDADYITHTQRCLDHLLATQPVDKSRLYFSGNSGGARVAFTNSVKFKGAGVLAIIAGAAPGEIQRKMDYYFISGSTDFNRSGMALSFKEAKSSGAFRFHPGGHDDGPQWLQTEGIIWLQTKSAMRAKSSGPEREEFDNAAMTWAESLKQDQDYRAGWWAHYLTTTGLTPAAKSRADKLTQELAAKPTTSGYIDGISSLEKFAMDVISEGPQFSPDCFEHTSPAIQKAVDKLLEHHATTPWVNEILAALKNKTGKG